MASDPIGYNRSAIAIRTTHKTLCGKPPRRSMVCTRGAAGAVASSRFCKTARGVIVAVDVEPGAVVVRVDVTVTADVAKSSYTGLLWIQWYFENGEVSTHMCRQRLIATCMFREMLRTCLPDEGNSTFPCAVVDTSLGAVGVTSTVVLLPGSVVVAVMRLLVDHSKSVYFLPNMDRSYTRRNKCDLVFLRLVPSLNSHHRLNSHRFGLHTVVRAVVLKIPVTEVVVEAIEV